MTTIVNRGTEPQLLDHFAGSFERKRKLLSNKKITIGKVTTNTEKSIYFQTQIGNIIFIAELFQKLLCSEELSQHRMHLHSLLFLDLLIGTQYDTNSKQ